MAKEVFIGNLDRRISIYLKVATKSTTGETSKVDALVKTTWAKVENRSENETEEGKIYLVAIRDYTIRFDADVYTDGEMMFIQDADGDYHVTGIREIGRKDYLTLTAVKRE